MINQEQIIQELKKDLIQVVYDYIDIEFIIQEIKEKIGPEEDEKKQIYEMGPKISRKKRRKDRKSRQKSWIECNRRESEFFIAKYRILR
jgi:hypothetical protein